MSTTTFNSDRTPKWRSLSSKKKPKPATSVSLIFAQPQQGAPLRSAVDNLPAVGIDDSASFISEMSRKRERLQSMSSAFTLGDQSSVGKEDSGSVHKRSRTGSIASAAEVTPVDCSNTPEAVIDLTMDEPMAVEPSDTQTQVLTDSSEQLPNTTLPSNTDTTPPIPFPSQTRVEPLIPSPASRSSWFASFSRSKGKDKASTSSTPVISTESTNTIRPTTTTTHSPTSSVLPTSQTTLEPSASATVPIAVPTAMYPQDPAPATPQIAGSPVHGTSNTTSISSVDDEVPRLRSLGNSPSNQASLAETVAASALRETAVNRKPSMTSMNTTTSSGGFMLRLPLLGRPKMPLNEVVAAAAHPPSESAVAESSPAMKDERASVECTSISEEGQIPNKDDVVFESPVDSQQDASSNSVPTDVKDAPVDHDQQQAASTSSWWGYLGLAGSSAGAQPSVHSTTTEPITSQEDDPSKASNPEPPTASLPKSSSCPDLRVTPATPESVTPQPSTTDVAAQAKVLANTSSEPLPNQIGSPEAQGRPASLFSADTLKSQGSIWYSPWAWYYGSPPPASASTTSEPTTAIDGQPQPEGDSKTESEIVKEEALARDEPSPPLETPEPIPEPQQSPMSVALNPIESTISTNRSGWASFFMSRALLTKSITDEPANRDENGMEVMDIDDDDEQPTHSTNTLGLPKSPVTSITSTAAVGKEIVADKKQQSGTTPISPSGSPTRLQSSKQREPKKSGPPAAPLTNSESIKRDTTKPKSTSAVPPRTASPTPSQKSTLSSPGTPARTQQPNLVLPTWSDTFRTLPRSYVPPPPPKSSKSKLSKTFSFVSNALFSGDGPAHGSVKGKEREQPQRDILTYGQELPKALDILGHPKDPHLVDGNCRVVVIGVAGWSPGAVTRTIAGGLPSSSIKFVDMTCSALEKFEQDNDIKFKKITKIPLEGDGTIARKVAKVHAHLLSKHEWIEDLHLADVIFVAAHSQGSIVSIHLLDRLIREGHILTPRNIDILNTTAAMVAPGGAAPASAARTQRICCLSLCGIHLGPLRYLKTSSLLQPYIQYFENAAARELFEFQNTESQLSKDYVNALRTVMEHGAKIVYVASLNDQVVPIYSGLFTAASHPRILRALYIDGDAYHSSDFLSNLLVLLIRIMNAGLSDSGLLAHLSEATAGTLSGVGHSTPYEELATFSLAVDYMFLANDGADVRTDLFVEPFNAVNEQNDYEIPWSLRDLIADERVALFFAKEFGQLRDAFDDWSPKTTILRDIKRKLQPIQRLSTIRGGSFSNSKL